jgi:hypothetical protein
MNLRKKKKIQMNLLFPFVRKFRNLDAINMKTKIKLPSSIIQQQ